MKILISIVLVVQTICLVTLLVVINKVNDISSTLRVNAITDGQTNTVIESDIVHIKNAVDSQGSR